MSHYSSKINFRGATHPSNLSTTVAKWIALHLSSENFEDLFQMKTTFFSLSFSLIFFKSMCFLSFVGNVITYFMVISYRGVNCGSKQQLKNGLQPFPSFEIELH